MQKIYGYSRQKSYALESIKRDNISHFYIVSGESGCGKKTFVDFFSQAIFCEKGNACGSCPYCMKYESGNTVDLIRVKGSNKNSIGAKDIRTIIEDVYSLPIDSNHKIYIIDEGEKLTLEASNTLLKIFEEPPSYAIFFLLTSNKEKVLDTISSRATHIYLPPLDYDLVAKYIRDELAVFDEKRVDFLAKYSMGNIGLAREIALSESFFSLREACADILLKAGKKDARLMKDIKDMLEENKDEAESIFAILLSFLRDILVFRESKNKDALINIDKMHIIKTLSFEIKEPLSLYNGIIECIMLKDRSVNIIMATKLAFMDTLSEE